MLKSKLLFDFDNVKLNGYDYITGTDEAGRGAGAGPVCAAAVCFTNVDSGLIKSLEKLDDSKKLLPSVRNELYDIIIKHAVWSVAFGSVEDIEKNNILRTSLMAMNKACSDVLKKINTTGVKVLVDGNKLIPDFPFNQETVVKGDGKSASVAAASILAKVSRDRLMTELDKQFPEYFWADNKGYMTQSHLDAVDKYGLTKLHRKKYFENHFQKSKQLSLLN